MRSDWRSRYRPSTHVYPDILPPIQYGPDDIIATVGWHGAVTFKGQHLRVSTALKDQPIALRPRASEDGVYDLYYCHHRFAKLDLRTNKTDD